MRLNKKGCDMCKLTTLHTQMHFNGKKRLTLVLIFNYNEC